MPSLWYLFLDNILGIKMYLFITVCFFTCVLSFIRKQKTSLEVCLLTSFSARQVSSGQILFQVLTLSSACLCHRKKAAMKVDSSVYWNSLSLRLQVRTPDQFSGVLPKAFQRKEPLPTPYLLGVI